MSDLETKNVVTEDNQNIPSNSTTPNSSRRVSASGPCVCSNITMRQLFHELKALYPQVPDHIVKKCIQEHYNDRDLMCKALLLNSEQNRILPRGLVESKESSSSSSDSKSSSKVNSSRTLSASVNKLLKDTKNSLNRVTTTHTHKLFPKPAYLFKSVQSSERKNLIHENYNRRKTTSDKATVELKEDTKISDKNNCDNSALKTRKFRRLKRSSSPVLKNIKSFDNSNVKSDVTDNIFRRLSLDETISSFKSYHSDENNQFSLANSARVTHVDKLLDNQDNVDKKSLNENLIFLNQNFKKSLNEYNIDCLKENELKNNQQRPPLPTRPTSLDIKPLSSLKPKQQTSSPVQESTSYSSPTSVNVSVNLNVDIISPSMKTELNEDFCGYNTVNLTVRTPTSEPLPPVDIVSDSSKFTYTTSSFDPKKGIQSNVKITVHGHQTPSNRDRPNSSYIPENNASSPIVLSTRAESLPNLRCNKRGDLIRRQLERKERLRKELESEKRKLAQMKEEVKKLEELINDRDAVKKLIESEKQLTRDIRWLLHECTYLISEVDRRTHNTGVPLGETSEEFYKNIYTGQRGTLRRRSSVRRTFTRSTSHSSSSSETESGPPWTCHMCTFKNHPLLNKCEQCDMPRVVLGTSRTHHQTDDESRTHHQTDDDMFTEINFFKSNSEQLKGVSASPGDNIHIQVTPRSNRRVFRSWVVG